MDDRDSGPAPAVAEHHDLRNVHTAHVEARAYLTLLERTAGDGLPRSRYMRSSVA